RQCHRGDRAPGGSQARAPREQNREPSGETAMKTISLLLLLVVSARAGAMEPATDPSLVVVRIKSHGASGAVIGTTDGKSWILSCAHMFYDGKDRVDPSLTGKNIVIDGPAQPYAQTKLAPVRVIGADPIY